MSYDGCAPLPFLLIKIPQSSEDEMDVTASAGASISGQVSFDAEIIEADSVASCSRVGGRNAASGSAAVPTQLQNVRLAPAVPLHQQLMQQQLMQQQQQQHRQPQQLQQEEVPPMPAAPAAPNVQCSGCAG